MTGRILAITGAFGILGQAVARAAAEAGERVALMGRGGPPPDLPEAFVIEGADLSDAAEASAALDSIAQRLGGLDALINVAGAFRWQTLEGGDMSLWPDLYRRNLLTAANASRAAIPHLRRSEAGRIVNVGAAGAVKAAAGMGPYAAAKSAVHRLTESLAEELKPDAITVNAVLPSIIDTPANRADMPTADPSVWVAPKDLAAVILFLSSTAAGAVTGALIPVTGRV